MLKAGRLRVLSLDGDKVGTAGASLLASALRAAKPGGALTDLHLDREGNDLDEEAEKLLSKSFGAHPDACLHLARSEPENERLQQKAESSQPGKPWLRCRRSLRFRVEITDPALADAEEYSASSATRTKNQTRRTSGFPD